MDHPAEIQFTLIRRPVEWSVQRFPDIRHVVVTPMKNEEDYFPMLIESMLSQTFKPVKWIIVDDKSQDKSSNIALELASSHEWIEYYFASEDEKRRRGKKVARLFNLGLEKCGIGWDYCSKIDADMILPQDYFERVMEKFGSDAILGIASGNCVVNSWFRERKEISTKDHTRGGLKTYRRSCFEDIGGIREVDGWDGIDNAMAQMKGWKTKNFPDIIVEHLRVTGGHNGQIRSQFEAGGFAHFMGYYWPYIFARSIFQMVKWPFFIGGISLLFGYVYSAIRMKTKFDETEVVDFIRKEQRISLKIFKFIGIK